MGTHWSARYLGETGPQERHSRVRGRGYRGAGRAILNVGSEKSNTDGMAEMEVGALRRRSERALRCPGEHPSDEYECGEKLMSTRINAHNLT